MIKGNIIREVPLSNTKKVIHTDKGIYVQYGKNNEQIIKGNIYREIPISKTEKIVHTDKGIFLKNTRNTYVVFSGSIIIKNIQQENDICNYHYEYNNNFCTSSNIKQIVNRLRRQGGVCNSRNIYRCIKSIFEEKSIDNKK